MSRRNQDLVSRVRFEVDSRMANATMQALQTHAEKLNQQVAEVNASIKALGDVPDDSPALQEYRKQLRRLNSDLKDVNTTMKDYTRGVKAAGELYRHYAMGNIEDMSIKAIRAGVNGMKKRLDNLKAGGDPGDAEEMRLIEAITTEADVVVKRFKTDYQHVVEEITRGGTVTEQTLKRTRDGLADLMQTAETEAEKNELTNYWQKVGAAIEAVAVENRRLRGEVADREEAMRIAYATDHDGSQQAIHDAEARADAARRENDELRQRLDLKQQQRRELEQEMDINSMQQRSLMDRRDELKAQEKEDRAIRNQRVDDANKEVNAARRTAKTQQQAYDEQKQTVEKLRTEVQGLTDDIRKMGEVKAEPKIDTSELEAKLAEAKRVLGNASAFEKLAQAKLDGMRSVLTEQGTLLDSKQAELRKFTDATYNLQSRRDELNWAIEPFSRKGRSSGRYHFDIHDVEQQRVAVEKLDEAFRRLADDDYFKNASLARKYELLGTSAFGYSDAEQQFGSYERAIRSLGVAAEESGAKFRLLFQGAGVDKSFQGVEFLDGYVSRRKEIAKLNADIKKALGDTNIDELAREVDHIAGSYNKLAGEVQEQEQEVVRWGKLRQEYADNAASAERELAAAQQQSAQSSEQLAQKQEQLSQKTAELNQQQDKLNGMVDETVTANQRLARAEQEQTDARNAQAEAKKHEGEAVKKVEDELRGLTDEQLKNGKAYSHLTEEINADTAAMQRNITAEQEATREADRLRSGSIDKMEQALARLRESNRKLDPTIDKEEWERGERAIGQLNLRLEELKKQSAELRREPVLDMMTQRMDQLGILSRDALTETKKFWQAMYDGADKNDPELKKIEERLRNIATEEDKRRAAQAERVIGNMGGSSDVEIKQAVQAMEQLRDAQAHGNAEWERFNKLAQDGKKYLEDWATVDSVIKYEGQMQNVTTLSDAALQETKKFWETMVAGAEKGSSELREYEAHLEKVKQEEQERRQLNDEITVGRLNGDLMNFSTGEIDEAIKAGERLVATYKSGAPEAVKLAEKIAAAKEYIKTFGEEASKVAKNQVAEVEGMAALEKAQNGEYATASMDQLEIAIKRIKEYQTLIKDPKGSGADTFAAAKEQIELLTAQLDALKGKTDKAKAAFEDADAVIARFSEHMKGTVVTTPGQSIDEQLSQHTWVLDDNIKRAAENVDYYEQQIKEATDELERMEKELAELEKKHANSSWFRKWTEEYEDEAWRIKDLRDDINGHDVTREDGTTFRTGQKQRVEYLKGFKQDSQQDLDYWKQQKAEALGLVEVEEQVQKARRMTREEMQEGIKVLEAEAMAQDRSTADGQKRWEELRKTIGEMNQELKEATGEWMKLADAQKIAEGAGKKGFAASAQEIQQATQALERRREELIKQIRAERDLGNAVDAQEKELDDLTKKLRSLKFEQDNVNMSQEKMRTLIETPANAVNLDELRAAIKRADGQLRQMEQSLGKNSSEYKRFAEQVRNAKNVMKEMEGQAKASATAWEKAFNRLKTYVVMYMGFNEVWQKVSNTARDLMDLSDRMGEVRKTTGFTADEVGRLSENLKKMDVRTNLVSLLEISSSAGQLGLKTLEDVQGFTEAANKLMIALPEMGREAATEMMRVAIATGEVDKIRKQLQEGTIEGSSATAVAMEKIASTIDRLRASSASTAPEITDFVKRVGAVGVQSGITIDQVAALGSTVSSLGMRVEMSATALSRMLPAIRNNAFDIAKILGVTPNSIRELYDAGRGMEVILMIFQRIKDAGMDVDSIENMLGMGGMKEIMKELNQQGARAGIVFGGLSQNVDELRRQLGVAAQAYEENNAIQQEFERMNETTAAKWERLKNAFEEMFVGDGAQNALGKLIDLLRGLVNVLSGNVEPAFKSLNIAVWTLGAYFFALKSNIGSLVVGAFDMLVKGLTAVKTAVIAVTTAHGRAGLVATITKAVGVTRMYIAANWTLAFSHDAAAKAAARATLANNALAKSMSAFKANVVMAVIAAIGVLIYKMVEWNEKAKEGAREAARFQAELDKEQRKVDDLTDKIGNARVKIEEADKAVAKARAELDAAKKANDGTTEAVKRLTKAEAELLDKEEQKKNAMAEHKRLIEDFNTQYSKYLGFMLSEVSSNYELANARQLVNDKLRETLTLKQQEAAIERVENKKGEKRDEEYATLYDFVGKYTRNDPTARAAIMSAIVKAANSAKDQSEFRTQVKKIFKKYNIGTFGNALNYYESVKGINDDIDRIKEQTDGQMASNRQQSQRDLSAQAKAAEENYNSLETKYEKATGENKKRAAAALLQQMDTIGELVDNASSYYDISYPGEERLYGHFKSTHGRWYNNRKTQRDALLREAGKYYTPRKKVEEKPGSGSSGSFTTGSSSTSGYASPPVWGDEVPADSTEYSEMSVEELVARRKQMNKFKNVLKPGIDIRAVLAEDKALMKAIDSGKVGADWESVLGWYNTERKKIQQELKSERFSTNEGNWRDEKTKKGRKRRANPLLESDYALAELDRYYSRRKETLEKARIEENLSEEAFNRQAELLEQEHLEKRSKLRATFTGEVSKAETAAFRKWWDDLEKMNELDEVPWATVESEWAKATAAQIGRNNYRMQKDLTDMRMITVKHLNAIAKIIAKERPYDAITDNLRKNLTDMGILFADMEKDGGIMDTRKLVQAQARRMTALMELAEDAYSLTSKELMDRLRIQEYTHEWALAIEDDDTLVNALMAQLHKAYDEIQNAIQKEANIIKKQSEIIWKNAVPELGSRSRKDTFEGILSAMGLEEDRVKRANELIGAGQASERVADRLAIKQMQIRLTMEEHYYNLMQAKGEQRIAMLLREKDAEEEKAKTLQEQAKTLREQGREEEAITAERNAQEATQKSLQAKFDAQHAAISLNLSMSEEQKKIDEQRVEIANRLEESQNRLYKYMREWGELVVSSVQSIFEASHAGDAEYYNERAKMNLTGKGGPGAGTYIVIDNEGTSSARAHYEYLSEAEALERQHEIERENAKAEAWKKVMDDLNMKMSDMITDQINAMLQNAAVNANTKAVEENTAALEALNRQSMKVVEDNADAMNEAQIKKRANGSISFGDIEGETEDHAEGMEPMKIKTIPGTETPDDTYNGISNLPRAQQKRLGLPVDQNPYDYTQGDVVTDPMSAVQAEINADNMLTETVVSNAMKRKEIKINASNEASEVAVSNSNKEAKVTTENDKKEQQSKQSMFAKMTAAANLYGVAYQAMSNDNLDMAQKFEMIALQAVGNAAIAGLQVALSSSTAETATNLPPAAAKSTAEAGPLVGPILFAALSALVGGLMGLAASKVAKSKSQIAQVTGASVGAGRLTTGMLTYAEGNVNELTDPASLTPGRQYNVDGADGKTYRAMYMGKGAKTHITNGPEFHLVGEAGREAIIDAKTTRLLQMNETGIWRDIQTLYNGGSISGLSSRRRRGGVAAFADGNIGEFEEMADGGTAAVNGTGGMSIEMLASLQASIDRQSDLLENALVNGIKAVNKWTGSDGIPAMYNKMQKEAQRHGEKYL